MAFLNECGRTCVLTVFAVCLGIGCTAADERHIRFDEPVGPKGTVSFVVTPAKALHNGPDAKKLDVKVLDVPGLATVTFSQDVSACGLTWSWDRTGVQDALKLDVLFPNLPGEKRYHLLYTWDADAGFFYGYFNGVPMRMLGTVVDPWKIEPLKQITADIGDWQVEDLLVVPEYLSYEEAVKRVPSELRGRQADLMGEFPPRKPIDIDGRIGNVLYKSSLADTDSLDGWVLEGPGIISHRNGWMTMASELPNGPEGNIVHWAPPNFSDRFVAEWEMEVLSEEGLCIVFISARGRDGEDLFDPALPERDGVFKKYTKGGINTYHISYYTNNPTLRPGRVTSNLRKNHGFYLTTIGPAGIPTGSKDVYKIRLIRDKEHIQLLVDGKVIIDYIDDGKTYGPVHPGGKLGLRQMKWSVARYRALRVWELSR